MTRTVITSDEDLDTALTVIKALGGYAIDKPFMLTFEKKEKAKTERQNRLFHSLLDAFWYSGCSSFEDPDQLKNYYKKVGGMEAESYTYFNRKEVEEVMLKNDNPESMKCYPKPHRVYEVTALPADAVAVIANYKSWSLATKKQAQTALDALISDVYSSGANTDEKVQKILIDLEGDRLEEYEK
jgi:hypothetical protein